MGVRRGHGVGMGRGNWARNRMEMGREIGEYWEYCEVQCWLSFTF